jgi:hypothetical protein
VKVTSTSKPESGGRGASVTTSFTLLVLVNGSFETRRFAQKSLNESESPPSHGDRHAGRGGADDPFVSTDANVQLQRVSPK